MRKKVFTALFAVMLLVASIGLRSQAMEKVSARKINEGGSINKIVITFTREQANAYIRSIEEANNEYIESLENEILLCDNQYEKKILMRTKEQLAIGNAADMFVEKSADCFEIQLDYALMTQRCGGSIPGYSISSVSDSDKLLLKKSNNGNGFDVYMSFETFAEGASSMSERMNSAEGQVTCRFYPVKVPAGQGYTLGKGVGASPVLFDPNIVKCNKCDTSWNDNITATQFALGKSDCALSVKYGLLYAANPTLYKSYANSFYCVIESVQGDVGKPNIYCNGTKKSGSHVNCSWFTGIGHSESFHVHIY